MSPSLDGNSARICDRPTTREQLSIDIVQNIFTSFSFPWLSKDSVILAQTYLKVEGRCIFIIELHTYYRTPEGIHDKFCVWIWTRGRHIWAGSQCFHFQRIFLVLAKSKEFCTPQEFFKEFQKFKEFQGNLRKEKEIIQKFKEFKEIWVKCKETESNSRKITIPEALARVFHMSTSLLLKRTIKRA